jgi:hypothetical protein
VAIFLLGISESDLRRLCSFPVEAAQMTQNKKIIQALTWGVALSSYQIPLAPVLQRIKGFKQKKD